ncbi:MAG: TetR family transcriptional regulator [Deltaproteobacteria bacterium]|nr:MAG: TetR family transcriptional regulator [Deltaproteobacteria bacterium]
MRAARRPDAPRRSGEETRAAILAAAERHFAERGFEAARLEDIAADVGVRRAAIFYHFPDKQELYAAVLDDVLGGFTPALPSGGSTEARLEVSMRAWIDYVAGRPTLARLILREAASAQPGVSSPLARAGRTLVDWMRERIAEGVASGELEPLIDPHRFISLMGAATVFHFASMSSLTPDVPFDPASAAEQEKHKRELLRMARHMLGITARD